MVNVLQRNMSAVIPNTSSQKGLRKRRAMALFYRFKNWDNSAASLSHHQEQKKTGQGFPHAWALSFGSRTVWQWPPVGTGDGDWASAFGLRPPCRAQTCRKQAGRRCTEGTAGETAPHCWQREKSQATPLEKAASQNHGGAEDLRHGKGWSSLKTHISPVETSLFGKRLIQNSPGAEAGKTKQGCGPTEISFFKSQKKQLGSKSPVILYRQHLPDLAENPQELTNDWYMASYEIYSINLLPQIKAGL